MHARKTPLPNSQTPPPTKRNGTLSKAPVSKGAVEMQVVIVNFDPSTTDDSARKRGKLAATNARGPLVAGDEINIYEPKNIGFIAQYFTVGLILGGLPATVYGVFLGYLNVPAYVYATAGVITTLPWSFKFLFG